jgi:transcriptional regulator with PAS, ATPase and Fis domain
LTLFKKNRDLLAKPAPPLIGRSEQIQKVMASIQEVAELPATVLISGETGTGKDLVARLIHELSGRPPEAFFPVSCSEFAPGILESELFGHEKGAFTGALAQRKGFFEVADQGTLFLDEINDAPAALQAKLLRVIESKQYTRVGGSMALKSDFRLLAATNHALEKSVAAGTFRNDLYYRIKVYEIEMPPLRHRKQDIPLLAEFYLKHYNQAYGRVIEGFSEGALQVLRAYDWPGNVRELVNVIERAVIICKEAAVTTAHLPFDPGPTPFISDLNLADMERFYIELALKRTVGNKTRAARLLGISRKTLIEKVKDYQWKNKAGD